LLITAASRSTRQELHSIERFGSISLFPFDPRFEKKLDWEYAVLDWRDSSITRPAIYTI